MSDGTAIVRVYPCGPSNSEPPGSILAPQPAPAFVGGGPVSTGRYGEGWARREFPGDARPRKFRRPAPFADRAKRRPDPVRWLRRVRAPRCPDPPACDRWRPARRAPAALRHGFGTPATWFGANPESGGWIGERARFRRDPRDPGSRGVSRRARACKGIPFAPARIPRVRRAKARSGTRPAADRRDGHSAIRAPVRRQGHRTRAPEAGRGPLCLPGAGDAHEHDADRRSAAGLPVRRRL